MKTGAPSLFAFSLALAATGCASAPSMEVTSPGDSVSKEAESSARYEAYVDVVELPIEASGNLDKQSKAKDEGGGGEKKPAIVALGPKGDAMRGGDGDTEGARPDDAAAAAPMSAATADAVSGRVDAAQIRAAVARNMAVFAACLEVDSVVEIDATISAQGEVSQAKATRSQPDNPKTRDCVGLAFTRIRLEPLSPPAPAHVRLALSLRKPSSY